jgi:MFS family permease
MKGQLMTQAAMNRNIKLLYGFKALRSALFVMPVIVPFWQSNGLSQTQIYILQSIFAVGIVVLEVPSGYMADKCGRKCSLLVGAALSTFGFVVYSASFSFWPMAFAELVLGFGASFISGADAAMAYDSLLSNGEQGKYRKYEAAGFSFMGLSEAAASVVGGLVAIISVRATIVAQVLVYGSLLPIALAMTEPPRHVAKAGRNVVRDVFRITKYALHGHSEIKWLIFYAAVVGTLTHTMIWLTQPYYQLVGVPLGWFGVLWASQLLSIAAFARFADRYEAKLGKRTSLASFVVIGVASYAILALFQSVWLLPVLLGFYFIRAVFTPIIRDYLNAVVESKIRATVLSVQSLAQKFLYIGAGPLIGWVMDVWSLQTALLFSAIFYGALGAFVIAMMKRSKLM